jgi:hypothetical protein
MQARTAIESATSTAAETKSMFNITASGMVTDINNKPVANALIKSGTDTALTNALGYFTLPAKDSNTAVTIISANNKTLETVLQSNRFNRIAVQQKPTWLSTVPVIKLTTPRAAKDSSAAPSVGWKSLQDYVYEKLQGKLDTSAAQITGSGEIEFLIAEDGSPHDFKIIKSFGAAIDTTLIDALKKGPTWIGARKNKREKISIQF